MIASVGFLTVLVGVATLITAVSPLLLILLLIKDWKGRRLW